MSMQDLSDIESRRPSAGPTGRSHQSQYVTTRLLEAAAEVFGEHGYEAARIHEVARRCGLTTGAVYSRWPTKQELFVAVVQYVTRQRAALLVDSVEPTAERLALLARGLLAVGEDTPRDFMLEAHIAARRDNELQARISASLTTEASALSAMVADGKASGAIDTSWSTEAVVLLYQSLGLGTRLARSMVSTAQPKATAEEWEALMVRLVEAVEQAQERR